MPTRQELSPEYGNLVLLLIKIAEESDINEPLKLQHYTQSMTALFSSWNPAKSVLSNAVKNAATPLHEDTFSWSRISSRASTLANNIGTIMNAIEDPLGGKDSSNCPQKTFDSIYELWDASSSFSLQTATLATIEKVSEETESRAQSLINRTEGKLLNQIKAQQEESRISQEKQQVNNVTILGIFSAIALAINTGIGFSASAIQVLGYTPSIDNLLVIILAIGLIVSNVSAVLLSFVWTIVKSNPKLPCQAVCIWVTINIFMCAPLGILLFRVL